MMIDYSKFPSVLKNVLNDGTYAFNEKTQFKFEPRHAYRVISRIESIQEKDISIVPDDFKSYAELGKKIPRGATKDLSYYSCSFFSSLDALKLIMKLPRPNKNIIEGDIIDSFGPILINERTNHIDLWLYENVNIQNYFSIMNER